jgi:DNA polymerase III subunit epsilon
MKILYIDLETTGLDTSRDRIIEIGFIVEDEANGQKTSFEAVVNPGMPIPPESTKVHGIKNEDVVGKPELREVWDKVSEAVLACEVVAGYNVSFDLKVLMAEGRRLCKPLPLHSKQIWDMQKIFFHHEPRTLSAAVKFYCNKDIENAHRALGDVEATLDVFKAQQKLYGLDMKNPEVLAYSEVQLPLDSNGAFALNEKEEVVLCFGKFKGRVMRAENVELKNYLSWMIGASFPPDTKSIAKALLKGKVPSRENLEQLITESIL